MARMPTASGHLVTLHSLVFLLVLGVGTALGAAADTPRKGGTLRVATSGEPPSLDPHATSSGLAQFIAMHHLESLYTTGKDYGPIPMLAEGHTVSDDGLVYTVKLRRGVRFHHGKELTAEDTVPSVIRWGRMHGWGKELFRNVESVKPLDKYTLQMRLKEKSAIVLPLLIGAIYPKEVLEEAGDGPVKTFIGTGPFRLAEHQLGRSLKLVRFEQYRSRPEPPEWLWRWENRLAGHAAVSSLPGLLRAYGRGGVRES
jgi:peptide/nickel transport system substrate-binding protein